ncbi:DNA-binding transcriptional regulator YhcF (GntR family) [Granulicella mallensis]|uniref:DNA-binding transcriptional regulator YhcF (GntR family) n=2 Tax=Granulicella mallensis TaxID=940614 RepID=A0A7W7ZNZ5_9BACT|nr:DNA-binding transcriptional regulator YhcF (GntR family) [Granulicella mallensis]
MNPNTIIKVYRELENEGVLEIHHGLGVFVSSSRRKAKTGEIRDAQQLTQEFVDRLREQGLREGEIRRLVEAALANEFQRR